ncbi:hypothetical protein JRO89_XS12G0133700 [Xanthoceras sorbifolium]|uniref:VQ domain-containing protein n=1 Tax=Xanthoceras sorbifolium TaxID=99658 RepID=A0ABQ8HCJ4_9ROSI|nr:hypothetical protein JRO89_XS12G0133700 [Xanthoceras sorbifolium]
MSRRSLSDQEPRKLQGPRPATLKKPQRTSPVIVYLVSPKIIHVRPEEFMGLVQRLTGREPPTESSSSSSSSSCVMETNRSIMINHDCGADQAVCVSSPPSTNVAAFPSSYMDIYANWDEI